MSHILNPWGETNRIFRKWQANFSLSKQTLRKQTAGPDYFRNEQRRKTVILSTANTSRSQTFVWDFYAKCSWEIESDDFFWEAQSIFLLTRPTNYIPQITPPPEALQDMKRGKSPGIDGIPTEFYAQLWSELAPVWLEMRQVLSTETLTRPSFPSYIRKENTTVNAQFEVNFTSKFCWSTCWSSWEGTPKTGTLQSNRLYESWTFYQILCGDCYI